MKNRLKRIFIYIKSNLNNISSIASIICLLDCVLIPFITVVISIFNVVNGSENGEAQVEDHHQSHHHGWHEIVEKIALYVMTPIISFTTIYNFVQLKNFPLLLTTLIGITMFVLSHAHIEFSSPSVANIFKKMHIPMAILAAIFLVSTNYAAHQLLKSRNMDRCCKHKKISHQLEEQSCEQHHHHPQHPHHHHHYDLEMNDDTYGMHSHPHNNDNVVNLEKFYNIGFHQHNDHELVRFL
ncbi:conserved Plasmodium protein, unknown function [Plasmodium vivax]|uniref:MerC domain-containing protein n=2 Tax=Plasmodium vivax TaxID=5855 RepID=A0A1G4GYJ1_PLAVI|nr:conserved Plasmodium protein, unknown function [Plasmodium vivax]